MDGLGLVLDLVSPAGLILSAGADLSGCHAVLPKVLQNQRRRGGTVSWKVISVLFQVTDAAWRPQLSLLSSDQFTNAYGSGTSQFSMGRFHPTADKSSYNQEQLCDSAAGAILVVYKNAFKELP